MHGLDCASEVKDVLDMAISNPSQDVVNQAMENRNYETCLIFMSHSRKKFAVGTLAKHRNSGWTIWIRFGLCYDFSEQPSLTI